MRPIDPLAPFSQSAPSKPRLRWPHVLALVLLGCVLLWLLLSRANAPEDGGVREGRRGGGNPGALWLVAGTAAGVALVPDPRGERTRRETERTVLEYEAGDLSEAEADAFSLLLDRGVQDLEALLDPSLPTWARRTAPIRYVVSARIPMSRTRGTTVLLPLERVRTRSAPYLHETVHALVPSRGDRIWLSEGLASYLESWVSENRGGYDAHIFTKAGDRGIHAAAEQFLEREAGRAVLPWVGGQGEPPLMEEDRTGVARPFYILSQSLTKYVVDSAGLGVVVRSMVEGGAGAALELGGRSEADWKRAWMAKIKTSPPPPG